MQEGSCFSQHAAQVGSDPARAAKKFNLIVVPAWSLNKPWPPPPVLGPVFARALSFASVRPQQSNFPLFAFFKVEDELSRLCYSLDQDSGLCCGS